MNALCANCNSEVTNPVIVPAGIFCNDKCHAEYASDLARAKGLRASAIFDNPDPQKELWPDVKWGNTEHWTA